MARRSKYGKLNARDFIHGLAIAVASAIITFCTQVFYIPKDGFLPNVDLSHISMDNIGKIAFIASITYIGKQLHSNSKGQLWKKELSKPDTDKV